MLPLALICDQPSDNDNELSVFKYSLYLGIPLQSTDNSKLKFNLPIYIIKWNILINWYYKCVAIQLLFYLKLCWSWNWSFTNKSIIFLLKQ